MLRDLTEKLREKLLATICGYSGVKFAHIDDAFSNKPSRRSLQQKDKKRGKWKDAKKNLKMKSLRCRSLPGPSKNFDFCI